MHARSGSPHDDYEIILLVGRCGSVVMIGGCVCVMIGGRGSVVMISGIGRTLHMVATISSLLIFQGQESWLPV